MSNLFDTHIYTFDEIYKSYLLYLSVRVTQKTALTYSGRVQSIFESCDLFDVKIDSLYTVNLLKSRFTEFLSNMEDYSINYKNLNISAFNDFCRFSCKTYKFFCGLRFEHLKRKKSLPKAIPEKVLLSKIKLLSTSRENWIDHRNFALIHLLYATGVRISEALHIQPSDFYKEGMLLVRNGKNAKERVVYYPMETIKHINQYRLLCPYETSRYLWRSQHGKALSRNSASVAIKKIIGHSPHALRHSFATHLHSNGCDIFVLSELLGHSTLMSTQIYTKIQKKELRKCVLNHHPFSKRKSK